MSSLPLYIVDVFAEEAFAGNQLAVLRGNPDAETMQKIALEMYYSETTFIAADEAQNGGYNVRIFTPNTELPFAGHPTLGTAFVIQQMLIGQPVEQVTLNLAVGQIPVRFADDGVLWMRQNPPEFGHVYDPAVVADVLNLSLEDIDTRFPVQESSTGLPWIMAPLKTLDAVKRAEVNLPKFRQMITAGQAALGAKMILVFAPEAYSSANALNARGFAHLSGVPEDPATGSANGDLAAYLVHHNYFGEKAINITVEQGYEINRPSLLRLNAWDAGDHIEVNVGGRVRMVVKGELFAS